MKKSRNINKSNEDFNKWHSERGIDFCVDTPWHRFFINNIKEFISKEDKILEIGCGRGGFAFYFSKTYNNQFAEYEAADFSVSALDMAKKHQFEEGIGNINFSVKDIQNIDFPNNYFDKIICFETIEHVPNPKKAVKELHRVLKPGGHMVLTTPNYLNFYGAYRIFLRLTGRRWTEVDQPINKFVMLPKTLLWLKSANFKVLKYASSEYSIPWLNKKVYHFKFKPAMWNKYFGLQSFFLCKKK